MYTLTLKNSDGEEFILQYDDYAELMKDVREINESEARKIFGTVIEISYEPSAFLRGCELRNTLSPTKRSIHMTNDKEILSVIKDIGEYCEIYTDIVTCANPMAATDRIVENILSKSKELEHLYDTNKGF